MGLRAIQRAGSLLGLIILVTLLWYGRSARLLLAGVLYLIAASCLSSICVLQAISLRAKQRKGIPEPATWLLLRKAYVFLLFAWELAILGLLNIRAFSPDSSQVSLILSYLLVGVFGILSYRIVGLADSPKQDGGSKLINYFGRPRSRRIFFVGFVYTPIGPLIIMSLAWSRVEWCPRLLQPPLHGFLLIILLSTMSAGMVFQRYRGAATNQSLALKVIVPTVCGLVCTGILQAIFEYSLYVYALSSISVICMAAAVYWLLLAKEVVPVTPLET